MGTLQLVHYPDSILSRKADSIAAIEDSLFQHLIDEMISTLHAHPGIGLAAPQVGQSIRLFVFDLSRQGDVITPYKGPHVVINPEILEMTGEDIASEGCLSIPGYRERFQRAAFVRIKGLDRTGQEMEWLGEGLTARLFQHEVDHLNGTLIIDRFSSLKKDVFSRWFKKRR